MSQFLVKDDGDIDIANNNFVVTSGVTEIRQRLLQNIRTFLGEWFLDTTLGVPYYEIVFEKGAPANLVEDTFKDVILSTEGIIELIEFKPLDLDTTTRSLTVDFHAASLEGEIIINEVVI